MKKLVIALMAVMLVAGLAMAEKPALEKPVTPYTPNGRAAEVEPNNDYMTATPLVLDDDMSAAINVGGDLDFFSFEATAGLVVNFETRPGDVDDTRMYLYDVDGTTQLAYNDDGGQGAYSALTYEFPADGTYFIEITGYSTTHEGTYILTAGEDLPCPAPENNTCDGALELVFGSTFTVDNCGATNDYDLPFGGCTGYPTHGLDLVYYVDLVENQELTVTASTGYDNALYLVTDCSDVTNSCVAGVDEASNSAPETLVFDAADAPGRYYLILDGYSNSGQEDEWEITVGGVVATQQTTFDSLKSMYR